MRVQSQMSANYFVHEHFQVANIPEILVLVRCIRSNEYMFYTSFSENNFLLGLLLLISVQFKKIKSKLDYQAHGMQDDDIYWICFILQFALPSFKCGIINQIQRCYTSKPLLNSLQSKTQVQENLAKQRVKCSLNFFVYLGVKYYSQYIYINSHTHKEFLGWGILQFLIHK